MSFAALLQIVLDQFGKIAGAWPLLAKLLAKYGGQLVAAAEAVGDLNIGETPDNLKAAILNFLTAEKDKASGPVQKIMYAMLIAAVPSLIDGVWDQLHANGRVSAKAETFTCDPPKLSYQPDETVVLAETVHAMAHCDHSDLLGLPA